MEITLKEIRKILHEGGAILASSTRTYVVNSGGCPWALMVPEYAVFDYAVPTPSQFKKLLATGTSVVEHKDGWTVYGISDRYIPLKTISSHCSKE